MEGVLSVAANTYISLFSGAAGLDVAIRLAIPDARCACFVEREIAAANILATRMEKGDLEEAPIWSDVRTFDGRRFRGRVAGIAGGFPCTDLSVAGKRAGIHGEASGLFFEYVRIIREVGAGWVAVENVPPVLAFPAGRAVLGELSALGFHAEWLSLRASDVGASHGRKRVFILAYKPGVRFPFSLADVRLQYERIQQRPQRVCEYSRSGGDVENTIGGPSRQGRFAESREAIGGRAHAGSSGPSGVLDHTASPRLSGRRSGASGALRDEARWPELGGRRDDLAHAECSERWSHDQHRGDCGEGRNGEGQAASWLGERGTDLAHAERSNSERRGITGELADEAAEEYREACERQRDGNAAHDSQRFLADSGNQSPQGRSCERRDFQQECATSQRSGLPLFAPGPSDPRWAAILAEFPELAPALSRFDRFVHRLRRAGVLPDGMDCTPERVGAYLAKNGNGEAAQLALRRVAHELAHRVDEFRACGNGVAIAQGALAFLVLAHRAGLLEMTTTEDMEATA